MKISYNHFMVLLDTLRGSLGLQDGGRLFSFNSDARLNVFNKLISMDDDVDIEASNEAKDEKQADEFEKLT